MTPIHRRNSLRPLNSLGPLVLSVLAWLPLLVFTTSSYAAQSATPPSIGRLVLAHYMPSSPTLGANPSSSYWYTAEFNPAHDARGGLTARPCLMPRSASDPPLQGYIDTIRLAKSYGIDGFLVDELEDQPGYRDAWLNLLKAAQTVGGFKIGLQPDYSTLNNPSGGDIPNQSRREKILHWLRLAQNSPALLRLGGKPVIVVYGGGFPDARQYDQDKSVTYPAGEKRDLVDWLAAQGMPVAYAADFGHDWPVFKNPYANDPATGYQTFAFAVGSFNPGYHDGEFGGNEMALRYWPTSLPQIGENRIMYNSRGWYYTGDRLTATYRHAWEWNIAHRDRVPWIMLITWNDWGESALAPSVNHFMAWQPLTRYYADWYKTGRQPKITQDWVAVFHRPHPYAAVPTRYPFQLQGPSVTAPADEVEAVALLTRPATLVIDTGGQVERRAVPAGLQSFIVPFALGVQSAGIERGSKVAASATSPVPITDKPARQCLWFIAADSAHPPRPVLLTGWDLGGSWHGAGDDRTGTGLTLASTAEVLGDCAVSAAVTPGPDAVGVVARAQPSGYYALTVRSAAGGVAWSILRHGADGDVTLDSGTTSRASAQPCQIRLQCVGEHLIAFIDDRLVSSSAADWNLAWGQAGLLSGAAPTRFQAVSVQSYDPNMAVFK